MFSTTTLHQLCNHGADCCFHPREVLSFGKIFSHPVKKEFDRINEPEIILFHGTSRKTSEIILRDGFAPELCSDPSFGEGLYMTSCFNFACGFGGYPQGVVFMCRVKPGIMLGFDQTAIGYVKEGQDSNVNFITNEYVIYDKNRVIPIALIENVLPQDTLLTTLPGELSLLISAASKSLDDILLAKQTNEEVDWLCEHESGLTSINIVPTSRTFGGCVARHRKGKELLYYRIIDKDGKHCFKVENTIQMGQGFRICLGKITGMYNGITGTQTILDISSMFTLMKKRAEPFGLDVGSLRGRTLKFLKDTLKNLSNSGPGYQELYLESCCRHLGLKINKKEEMITALEKHINS